MMCSNLLRIFALLLSLFLQACVHSPQQDDRAFAPVLPDVPEPMNKSLGSLYQTVQNFNLYEDVKALKVGDLLTVKLVENTNASKVAETKNTKTESISIPEPTLLSTAADFALPHALPLKNTHHLGLSTNNGSGVNNAFNGKGQSMQNNRLTGDISVIVAQIYPNKNLFIRGEKWVELNQGSEYMRLSGIVRPEDIGPNNTIDSTKIANVRISYSGTGTPAETNQMGWLARFFNGSWMPF